MTGGDERQIIEAVLRGERAAYAVLVDRYKDRIFGLAYRMTGCRADADDLAQEAFLRAYGNLARFDREKSFFTWLYTIALNVVRSHLNKRSRDPVAGAEELMEHTRGAGDGAEGNPEDDLAGREEEALLRKGLLTLPLDTREAVVLRFYQDLSFEETAAVLGISLSAAKMRVYRGLEKLRECLAGEY